MCWETVEQGVLTLPFVVLIIVRFVMMICVRYVLWVCWCLGRGVEECVWGGRGRGEREYLYLEW